MYLSPFFFSELNSNQTKTNSDLSALTTKTSDIDTKISEAIVDSGNVNQPYTFTVPLGSQCLLILGDNSMYLLHSLTNGLVAVQLIKSTSSVYEVVTISSADRTAKITTSSGTGQVRAMRINFKPS